MPGREKGQGFSRAETRAACLSFQGTQLPEMWLQRWPVRCPALWKFQEKRDRLSVRKCAKTMNESVSALQRKAETLWQGIIADRC